MKQNKPIFQKKISHLRKKLSLHQQTPKPVLSLEKAYDSKKYEDAIYAQWEKSGIFSGKIKSKKAFTINMPPPNATGMLHMGHATMLAIEDIMVRFKRMQGFSTLWIPGTDHASIASQNKVEKMIAEEGQTRHTLGRELFLKKVEKYVQDSRSTIRNQIRKMGASCDWTRERYTMDNGISKAVREIFVRMYRDGLIYRGNRIVNWCVRCSSPLADDEVEFKEEKTKFYYFRYGTVIIGTARPETKFLDKVIVVHPEDKRYKKYIGKKIRLPWINGEVEATFIADKSADPEFGSGAMTITPAHSFVDFDIAKKHKLEITQIIDEKGNFTKAAGPAFEGKNAAMSREAIVKILEKKGLLEKIDENYVHNLSICYRCDTPIEPLISTQWFIDVNKPVIKKGKKYISLKQKAVEVVKNGDIKIVPDRFNKIYFHWLNNLRDWCISRQIWFGHQIPVWYCQKESCHPIAATEKPAKCPTCGNRKLQQDCDTLDTWFSSGLWTFATLGWPEKTKDLKYFHPTSVLETGYDILFFWVARMILMTTYALNEVPFKKVYLHGLVRDKNGKKMSKSLGNGIDPLDMINKFGTDAVRLSLVIGTSPGNDFRLYEEKIGGYRNFINKIWNGARFTLLNIPENTGSKRYDMNFTQKNIRTIADKWILSKLQHLIKEVTEDLENDRLSEAGTKIYDFTWSQYCDWYLEISKSENLNPAVLLFVLKTLLKLLHPFVPFVTEVLWNNLGEKKLLIGETWPKTDKNLIFKKEEKAFEIVKNIITEIRSIRTENNIDIGKKIPLTMYAGKWKKLMEMKREPIMRLARLEKLDIQIKGPKIQKSLWKYVDGIDLYIPLEGIFDLEKEKKSLTKKLENTKQRIQQLENKLSNPGFLKNAPQEVVAKEKEVFTELRKELTALENKMSEL